MNVRTGAGLDNTAFTQLPNGTVVDVIGRDGDWVKILLPARAGYVYGSYLTVTDAADSTVSIGGITLPFDEKELTDLWQFLVGGMADGSDALTPDGNLTLIDDIGTSTKAGKQFIIRRCAMWQGFPPPMRRNPRICSPSAATWMS